MQTVFPRKDSGEKVNDLDSDSTTAPATSLGYLHYPPPAVFMGYMHAIDRLILAAELPCMMLVFMGITYFRPQLQIGSQPVDSVNGQLKFLIDFKFLQMQCEQMTASSVTPSTTQVDGSSNPLYVTGTTAVQLPEEYGENGPSNNPQLMPNQMALPTKEIRQELFRDQVCNWELPFMQGWLMGQSQAGTSSSNRAEVTTTLPHVSSASNRELA
ncbi:Quinoprotein amine dehydrogenase, beta chain-like protein [Artemisia annua]|uniref:Quinoprotein amine dehydrogenase, beta chain-like protein n=1 Tax=Artemisia annua TaxID=35608 RepID=A0A2U1Q1H7_ARTAN|nr:Quinoprotein amine dehydrogenase, beta chain-like protein [Artemisia annua]